MTPAVESVADLDQLRHQLASLLLDGAEAGLRAREDALITVANEALTRRLQIAPICPPLHFDDLRDYLRTFLNFDFSRERSGVILLDWDRRLISIKTLSEGTLGRCLNSVREIFRTALLENSPNILLWHSHPGAGAAPSREDLEHLHVCLLIANALEINIVDAVILARGGEFSSARELGLLEKDTVQLAAAWQREQEAARTSRSLRSRWRQFRSLMRLARQCSG